MCKPQTSVDARFTTRLTYSLRYWITLVHIDLNKGGVPCCGFFFLLSPGWWQEKRVCGSALVCSALHHLETSIHASKLFRCETRLLHGYSLPLAIPDVKPVGWCTQAFDADAVLNHPQSRTAPASQPMLNWPSCWLCLRNANRLLRELVL